MDSKKKDGSWWVRQTIGERFYVEWPLPRPGRKWLEWEWNGFTFWVWVGRLYFLYDVKLPERKKPPFTA